MPVIYEPKGAAKEYTHLAINTYHGCSFACKYCYAPAICRRNMADWSKNPKPKANILARIEADAKKIAGDPREILLCYTSDPYQNAEAAKLTRETLLILEEYNLTATVLTKAGTMATQDFDILKRNNWKFGTTISLSCEQTRREWEPGAATIQSRKEAIIQASGMGIHTWVSMEPVIDPQQALNVIEHLIEDVDFWKIGKMNHRKLNVDWGEFYDDAVALLDEHGASYYIKKELRAAATLGSLWAAE